MQSQGLPQPQPRECAHEDSPCVQLVVKNTFFDCGETQSDLLTEGERQELLAKRGSRKARTCFVLLGAVPQPASPVASSRSEGATCSTVDTDSSVGVGSDGEGRDHQDGEAFLLRLHDALAVAAAQDDATAGRPGQRQTRGEAARAAGLLSVGSAGHSRGECKPCAFLDSKKGCFAGVECVYCHACDGQDKKRRQRERRKMLSNKRRLQRIQQDFVTTEG